MSRGSLQTDPESSLRDYGPAVTCERRAAGGTGERVARERLTGRVARELSQAVWSGPVGERATPTRGQDPQRVSASDDRVDRR